MHEQMEARTPWVPWAVTSVALLVVAAVAYYAGVQNGEALVARDVADRVWHGNGTAGLWILFMTFWVFGGLHRVWWGPYRHGRWYGRGCRRDWHDDQRDEWEAWHRRAHRAMDGTHEGGSEAPPRSR